jgi:hypothetical protein
MNTLLWLACVVVGLAFFAVCCHWLRNRRPWTFDDAETEAQFLAVRLAWECGTMVIVHQDRDGTLRVDLGGHPRPAWLGDVYLGQKVIVE